MQTVDQLCVQRDSRTIENKKQVSLGAPWPAWTLNLASVRKVQAVGRLGVKESRLVLRKEQVMGETVFRKTRFCVRAPIGGGAKRETVGGK